VGVAPGVDKLVSVRVAAACGQIGNDDLITAMKWIVDNASLPAVANLSLGSEQPAGPSDEDVEDEIDAAIQAGIVVVVSAGNNQSDACDYSPSRMADVITVAASDSTDSFAASYPDGPTGSNFGPCVDLLAPGVGVVSAAAHVNQDTTCTNCTVSWSGTSMAAPHVSGIAAIILEEYPALTPAQVKDTILARSTVGKLSGLPSGTPDRLAFTPRLLLGGIDGPDLVWDTASYEWNAEHEGGDFTYAFEWSRRWRLHDWTGPWHVVGTEDKLELEIGWGSPDFELRLKVWSGSQQVTDLQYVTVLCEVECVQFIPHPPG
jgi:subtilisin family serine protease